MNFEYFYSNLVEYHLGRRPRPEEAISDAAIHLREKELGIHLSASLRFYYRTAGNLPQLNKNHNILYDLADLRIEDGYLLFMEENQAVVHWCFRVEDLAQDDPEVWQRVNSRPPEWHAEGNSFTVFISKMLEWQAGETDPAGSDCV